MTLLLSLVCQPISRPSGSPETSVLPWGIHSWFSPWPRPQPPSLLLGTLPPASPRSLLHPLCSLTVTVMHRAQAGPSPLLLSPQSHWVTWCNALHTGTPTLLSPELSLDSQEPGHYSASPASQRPREAWASPRSAPALSPRPLLRLFRPKPPLHGVH